MPKIGVRPRVFVGLCVCALTGCGRTQATPAAGTVAGAIAGDAVRTDRGTLRQPTPDVAPAIEAIVSGGRHPAFGAFEIADREQVRALYGPDPRAPLWVDAAGQPSPSARSAMALLASVADDGLDPADYGAATLERMAAALQAADATQAQDVAAFDTGVSLNTLRYFRELHLGRVDPRSMGFKMSAPADEHDFPGLLRTALASGQIAETAATLVPPVALYRGLRDRLAQYRALAADRSFDVLPPSGQTVHAGEPYAGLAALHRFLVAVGDLPAETPAPGESLVYEGALVDGVKRFQARHGLEDDGVLGSRTEDALRVPLAWRARQIELAMERLRWLPDFQDDPFIAVNIPMFRLFGWHAMPSGAPSLTMGVIVGRAVNTQTPVLVKELEYIDFRPYWNVPASIVRHEMLPAIDRDPGYLDRLQLEMVSGPGDDAQRVPVTPESVAELRQGRLRLRQRPGAGNSLGLVKFMFPNDENVYMHGTPAQELFGRTRRDFSHGCVRLEDPIAMAEWALRDQPGWNRDRIVAAMQADAPSRVRLARPVRVMLFYVTAIVIPEDGRMRFAEDIYGYDAPLDRSLARRRQGPGTP